ncbi:MAG TPA: DUF4383 domain-containing protein [Usitatibacter sp.]|jgi:uncharacterized protein DUF4383|nr:DUF4383 domain-containing protein [Usitatibacter sp.]
MKTVALVIGIVLVLAGIAGFIPQLTPGGLLFGVMPMDTLRSVLFLVTGVAGIMIGVRHRRALVEPRVEGRRDLREM